MVRLKSRTGLIVLLMALCLLVPAAPAQSVSPPAKSPATAARPPKKHMRHKKAVPAAQEPQTPPVPPTLEQTPPTAPQVTYRNGQLTINAPNSTLSQVLRAVQTTTGASVEMPSSTSSVRVATQIGPGQPRDVLNNLLNGSQFNYIILGVNGDPGAVQKVMLTTKRPAANTVSTAQNASPGPTPQGEEAQDDETPSGYQPEMYQGPQTVPPVYRPQTPMRRRMPGGVYQQQPYPAYQPPQYPQQNNGENVPPEGAKTPEQLLQEMQEMQRRQQQLQEQLNPANRLPQ
jgi:hypothetical protein